MPPIVSRTVQVHIARQNGTTGEWEYLLLKRRPHDRLYPGIWQAVTGTIIEGERSIETALRELEEETGFRPEKFWSVPYMTKFYDRARDEVNLCPVFGAVVGEGAEVELSEEHDEFAWLKCDDCVMRMALPTHKEGHAHFRDYILNSDSADLYKIELGEWK